MRRKRLTIPTTTAALLLVALFVSRNGFVVADLANAPSLSISQLKINSNSGQFITLYNATDTAVDMSKYQLQYFNNYDLAKATSSKLIPLSGTVPPHGYFMVNDGAVLLCYQLTINSVSLGLSSTAGFIGLVGFNQAVPGSAVASTLQDYVGWSKTAVSGVQTLPASSNAFLQRQPTDSGRNPSVASPGAGSWQTVQADDKNACNLTTLQGAGLQAASGYGALLPSSEPPASIVSLPATDTSSAPPSIPAADIGLKAPQITELLPNPVGTGNDSSDEYIEVYNSNDKAFDLSGFKLQSGTTRPHTYVFPNGTNLPAKGFKAFYSDDTSLSLSNTSGQAKLLDPFDKAISGTAPYANAKDGQTWSLAKGKWYWTIVPTPSKANLIKQPQAVKKSSKISKTKTASTSKSSNQYPAANMPDEGPAIIPVHTRTLVLVIGAAILYGAYEYRADARNKLIQFRRNLSFRGSDRQSYKRRRGD
jgi:hypothetical protein